MREDLKNEVEAINSIYGDGTLVGTDNDDTYILLLRQHGASLRIQFLHDYPLAPPIVLGTESSGEHTRKGEAAHILEVFRDVLSRLYQPGEVCLFDVIEEVNNLTPSTTDSSYTTSQSTSESTNVSDYVQTPAHPSADREPLWKLSEVIVELKSVFVARCAPVSSPDQATAYLRHLLDSDKKVRSATHNITAWRIKGENGVKFQDCDDDGETAAGGRVLHLMQLMDIWNVMVVVTRWYGGHQLGPKRFSIINSVARDAFIKGGFFEEAGVSKKKGKK